MMLDEGNSNRPDQNGKQQNSTDDGGENECLSAVHLNEVILRWNYPTVFFLLNLLIPRPTAEIQATQKGDLKRAALQNMLRTRFEVSKFCSQRKKH